MFLLSNLINKLVSQTHMLNLWNVNNIITKYTSFIFILMWKCVLKIV